MRTGNPVFASGTYQEARSVYGMGPGGTLAAERPAVMTVQGTAVKTLALLGITIVVAAVSWSFFGSNPQAIAWASVGSLVASLGVWFAVIKKPSLAPVLVPGFAVVEGVFVAAASQLIVTHSGLAAHVGGQAAAMELVGQAAGLTMAIAVAMLIAYSSGLIRLRGVAAKVVIFMTAGVAVYYAAGFLVNMIFGPVIPRLGWDAGPIGIGFSVLVVVLASLVLVLDFQYIDDGVQRGLPKDYEWIGAFGLLTTLVWLYIELLRLLAKLRR